MRELEPFTFHTCSINKIEHNCKTRPKKGSSDWSKPKRIFEKSNKHFYEIGLNKSTFFIIISRWKGFFYVTYLVSHQEKVNEIIAGTVITSHLPTNHCTLLLVFNFSRACLHRHLPSSRFYCFLLVFVLSSFGKGSIILSMV